MKTMTIVLSQHDSKALQNRINETIKKETAYTLRDIKFQVADRTPIGSYNSTRLFFHTAILIFDLNKLPREKTINNLFTPWELKVLLNHTNELTQGKLEIHGPNNKWETLYSKVASLTKQQ